MADDPAATRLVFPGLRGFYDTVSPYSYTIMRFATGAIMVPHGIQKLFFGGAPVRQMIAFHLWPPEAWAYLVGVNEGIFTLCLALGLFTRFMAAGLAIEMFVIAFFIQSKFGYFWTSRGNEFPLLLMVLAIAIFFRGGGRYSLDHLIGREL
jgi:putative oxidoreductase